MQHTHITSHHTISHNHITPNHTITSHHIISHNHTISHNLSHQDIQHARHLREDQHAVAIDLASAQELLEHLQLAAVVLG